MSTASYLLCNILGKQTDPNWKPDPVTVEMIAQTLAAAEERGRRAGIEEAARWLKVSEPLRLAMLRALSDPARGVDGRDELLELLDALSETLRGLAVSAVNGDYSADKVSERLTEEAERIDAALAPRDSARCPEDDPLCACQRPMDAPRDSGKEGT